MTAAAFRPSTCVLMLLLGLASLSSGCNDREIPKTQSGEPLPFDHASALPSGHPPMPAASAPTPSGSAGAGQSQTGPATRAVKVSVKLSPAVSAQAAPGDAVFIFARAAQGPKMPLAIVRKQVKELPVNVTLDDSMAMVPEMKMSSFPELVIGARVSKSGDAITRPGDLEGYSSVLKPGATGPVEIVIASVVGKSAPTAAAGHPAGAAQATEFQHAKSNVKTRLNIPADVQAKWKNVELSVAGKNVGLRKLKIAVGGETSLDQSGLTLRIIAYVPAFQSDAGTVTSTSNNPDNPAVLVQLLDKGQLQSEGWVFQKLPDFNTYSSDKLQVQLLTASTGG